jgi:hypothetical protein
MINLEYTCIKKGNYIVATEEKPIDNPSPVVYPETDIDDPDFPVEIDYPDYDQDYGLTSVDLETDTISSEHLDFMTDEEMKKFTERSKLCRENYSKYLEVYPENDPHLDFDSIVLEVRQDIAEGKFLDKFLHYMELLKVNRYELDDFIAYDLIEDDFKYQINHGKVFDRLFELYCPDNGFVIPPQTNHHLREYIDRLEPDGRYFPKKQLTLFGGG